VVARRGSNPKAAKLICACFSVASGSARALR
jgi:hypothetical protein